MVCCFTVDDVGYEGYSTEAYLDRLLAFVDEHDVKATLFVVPLDNGVPLGKRPGYVTRLKEAAARGHEIGQHGLEHDRFEVGIPPAMILDLPHEKANRDRVARERDTILAGLTVGVIRARLARGRHILEEALDVPVRSFRAPALSICDNLFTALEQEGYAVDSSRHLQDAGWDLLNNKPEVVPRPVTRERLRPWQGAGSMAELALTTDYTWYLPQSRAAQAFDLAHHDLQACRSAGIPFVPLCHVAPLFEGEGDSGIAFYERLFKLARAECQAAGEPLQWTTLIEAAGTTGPNGPTP